MFPIYTDFRCPYCGHEEKRELGSVFNYKYNNNIYSKTFCWNCKTEFLINENSHVKMSEIDKGKLEFYNAFKL